MLREKSEVVIRKGIGKVLFSCLLPINEMCLNWKEIKKRREYGNKQKCDVC